MTSYVFRTINERIGFAQLNKGKCICYIYSLIYNSSIEFEYDTTPELTELKELINSNRDSDFTFEKVVEIEKADLPAGCYYPRTNKGNSLLSVSNFMLPSVINEVRAFNNLEKLMNNIFDVLDPSQSNKSAFGHKIRELLILACTEVEYLLLNFLKDNNYESRRKYYTTSDYCEAKDLLSLDEFTVNLTMHPELGELAPFKGWSKDRATGSLSWYSAYNSVKHDRGGNFHLATFGEAINAMAAIYILLVAQHGEDIFDSSLSKRYESSFVIKNQPKWALSEISPPIIQSKKNAEYVEAVQFFDNDSAAKNRVTPSEAIGE